MFVQTVLNLKDFSQLINLLIGVLKLNQNTGHITTITDKYEKRNQAQNIII